MEGVIDEVKVQDVRFPTSLEQAGSDAVVSSATVFAHVERLKMNSIRVECRKIPGIQDN